ncbi:hypothetical protein BH09PSE1_BH09PSE1_12520 [soil metagenome]
MIVVAVIAAMVAQVTVVNPSWARPPSGDLLDEPMPPFAMLIEVDGDVVLECRTLAQVGAPQNCEVVSTSVTGLGFEAKALEMATTGLINPRTVDGVPQPGRFRFRTRFRAEDVKPQPYAGPPPTAERLRLARAFVDRIDVPVGEDLCPSMFPELEPVRRQRVQRWSCELFPFDAEREKARYALFLARILTESELKTAVATGTIPREEPGVVEFDKASSDFEYPGHDVHAAELRARYCEAYDCGQAPSEH